MHDTLKPEPAENPLPVPATGTAGVPQTMARAAAPKRRATWVPFLLLGVPAALIAVLVGVFGSGIRATRELVNLSYDVPFLFYTDTASIEGIRIVFVDVQAERALQLTDSASTRMAYAAMIRKLKEDGARAVFFDVVFDQDSADPGVDAELQEAMVEHGSVFLGAMVEKSGREGEQVQRIVPPNKLLRKAARGWGSLEFQSEDIVSFAIRRLPTGSEHRASLAWEMATRLNVPLPADTKSRLQERYLRYYGPIGVFRNTTLDRVLTPEGFPPGFFKDKIVFVGTKSTVSTVGMGKDDFRHPRSSDGEGFVPGVDVHATAFSNLLNNQWLRRMDDRLELTLFVIFGVALGLLLPLVRPLTAIGIATACSVLWFFGGIYSQIFCGVWFAWAVPALLQAPVVATVAIAGRYLLIERRNSKTRKAMSLYLSDELARRIAETEYEVKLGGELVEVAIMFTDLEGFTTLSEKLGRPDLLSEALNVYYTRTTVHVLNSDGTLIKYIGDAILAIWGAPLPNPTMARDAVLAATRIRDASRMEIADTPLRTRIGLNLATVLVGHLGSERRADYTVVGDGVNFAARLEGLNKYLGTDILISASCYAGIGDGFLARSLGFFIVKGKLTSVEIYEIIDVATDTVRPPWLVTFDEALKEYVAGNITQAEALFVRVSEERGKQDGPSARYLKEIKKLDPANLPSDWSGVVVMTEK
jgi:adenylate cyclase